MDTPGPSPIYLKEPAASQYLNVSPRTLQKWRDLGKGPRVTRMGAAVRYLLADLEAFAAEGRMG